MEQGNRPVIQFCKKCKLIELIKESDKLMKELDVEYEEVREWLES